VSGACAAADVLFLDESERVLMVVPSYKDILEIPGGEVEPGEAPYAAACREVQEELGITPPIGLLLVADWWIDGPDEARLLVVFAGGVLDPAYRARIAVDGDEILDHGFHPVETLVGLTVLRLANRVTHALIAHRTGATVYLENGRPVGTKAGHT
jgi:8-oxo-dGTP pyrophosphatase MutT (NUDIX family)